MIRRQQHAFTLIELLIVVAITGIVAALALPAYRSYLDTTNMSKVNAAFENAVRIAKEEYAKNSSRVAMGLPPTLPKKRRDWIKRFAPRDVEAPGRGPMYSTKGKSGKPDEKGAIMVEKADDGSLILRRPAYLELTPMVARINADGVEIEKQQ